MREERIKSSINRIQLSPIKKFTNELTQYIHRQYLNIERLKPVIKSNQANSEQNSMDPPQYQGLLIKNITSKDDPSIEKRAKNKSMLYESNK